MSAVRMTFVHGLAIWTSRAAARWTCTATAKGRIEMVSGERSAMGRAAGLCGRLSLIIRPIEHHERRRAGRIRRRQ
ncbi:hypothetical protein DFP72DRAFT_897924 [Ephemerocybe angulata]|uniref:Secreted protein n=1 Tax=Ephemerocybe angulata TaxID=980116 RepID=A0A8H6HX79_9AGAR|nr:hypothetical protein DFP72DRAFT_897924 [Tulosesus angulatus]